MLETRLTQVADSRAVPEPRVSQRRPLRRRGDVDEPVRQARARSDARRGGADRRPGAGAVRALAVVESRWRASAQRSRARRGCGRRASSPPQEPPRARRSTAHPAVSRRGRGALRLREGVSAAAVPRPVRRRPAAGLGGAHDRSLPALQDVAEQCRGERSARGSASGTCRRRSSRSIPTPATCWPSSAAATSATSHIQSRLAQPASAGIGVQAVRVCGRARARMTPVTVLDGLRRWRRRARGMDAAQRRRARSRTELTLREAFIESNNRAAVALQQQIGTRPRPAARRRRWASRPARRAVAVRSARAW